MNFKVKLKIFTAFIIFFSFISVHAEDNVDDLIKQLGAESHEKREAATDKLWKMGHKCLDQLKKAAASGDPEIKDRAKGLIDKITLGITPDTPKAVLNTIQEFIKSSEEKKGEMLIGFSIKPGGWEIIRSLIYLDMNEKYSALVLTKVDSDMILNMRDQDLEADAGAVLELAAVFSGDPTWAHNYLAYIYESKSHKSSAERLNTVINKVKDTNFERKAAIHFMLALIYRSAGDYENAALQSREVYKIAFKNSLDTVKENCKPLFIDTHLLAGKYSYLEKFWEKTSFDIPEKERLWNMMFMQRLQGKDEKFQESVKKLTEMMDNENNYGDLARILLFNGEKEKALELFKKHKDFESLAAIAQSDMDYSKHVDWLNKSDSKEAKMEVLAFMAENAGKKEVKEELIKFYKEGLKASDSVTAALFLHQAGFKADAVKLLKEILVDADLEENDAYRAAWGLCENRSLAELFLLLRYKTRSKKIGDAVDFVHLLSLTEDAGSFTDYMDILQEKFIGYNREMGRIIEKLATFCLEKEWYQNAAAVTNLLPSAQRGIFNSILESEALVRKGDHIKAAHNLLGSPSEIKLSLPYYIVAQAYKMTNDKGKQDKALSMARYYDMAREDIMALTSDYLYENAYYEYFLEATYKLANIATSLSRHRVNAARMLSNSHIHNLKHKLAHKPFMQYYLLSSAKLEFLASPVECLRLAYQYNEFKLRKAVEDDNKEEMDKLSKKCCELFMNNIEVPILLKEAKNSHANKLFKDVFTKQWESMLGGIKKYPDHAILLNSAAWLGAICDHELKECLKMVEKAVKLSPSAANYDTLAEVQYRMKNYKEAVKNIEKAANLDKLEPFFKERVKKFSEAAKKAE